MLKCYRYLYYKVLRGIWSVRKSDIDEWTTLFIVTAVLWININSILTIPSIFYGKKGVLELGHYEVSIIGTIFLFIHYLLFIYKKRWKEIVNEFKDESEEQRKQGNRIALVYILGSPVLFFLLNIVKLILWAEPG